MVNYKCPCCHRNVFKELHCYEICPVCGWEDDPIQFDDPDFSAGANDLSLNDYRKHFFQKL